MFTLTIQANNPEELKLKLLGMLSSMKGINCLQSNEPVDTSAVDGSNVEAEIPEIPTENVPLADVPPVETIQDATEEVAPTETVRQYTKEEVRQVLKDLRDRKGASAVKSVLKKFGAENLLELKEEDYTAAVDAAQTEV